MLWPHVNGEQITELTLNKPFVGCTIYKTGHVFKRLNKNYILWESWTVENARLQKGHMMFLKEKNDGFVEATNMKQNCFALGWMTVTDLEYMQELMKEMLDIIDSWNKIETEQ